jgi:limonene-1,2-epoxide hydrolase
MGYPPESVVRRFLSASVDPTVEDLVGFFSDDAVWIDGPRGVHRGLDAIRTELELQLSMGFKMVSIQVKSLVANDGLVMMERVDNVTVGGTPFSIPTCWSTGPREERPPRVGTSQAAKGLRRGDPSPYVASARPCGRQTVRRGRPVTPALRHATPTPNSHLMSSTDPPVFRRRTFVGDLDPRNQTQRRKSDGNSCRPRSHPRFAGPAWRSLPTRRLWLLRD